MDITVQRDPRRAAPRIVLIDPDGWGSFDTWGAALARRGLDVERVAGASASRGSSLRDLRDQFVLGSRTRRLPPGARTVPAALARELLAPPTVDVHCSEELLPALEEFVAFPSGGVLGRVPTELRPLLGDKLAMTEFSREAGVSVPTTWTEPPEGVFPIVVKRSNGSAGRGVRIVHDPAELAQAERDIDEPGGTIFYQEMFGTQVVNVGGVARDGRILVSSVYFAHPRADDPLGPPELLEVLDMPGLMDELVVLLRDMSYTGVFCLDYVVADDRWALVDFNSRAFGGWLPLQLAGLDILGAYLSLLGLHEEPAVRTLPVGLQLEDRMRPRAGMESAGELVPEWRRSMRAITEASRVAGARYGMVVSASATLGVAAQGARRLRGALKRDRAGARGH